MYTYTYTHAHTHMHAHTHTHTHTHKKKNTHLIKSSWWTTSTTWWVRSGGRGWSRTSLVSRNTESIDYVASLRCLHQPAIVTRQSHITATASLISVCPFPLLIRLLTSNWNMVWFRKIFVLGAQPSSFSSKGWFCSFRISNHEQKDRSSPYDELLDRLAI